MALVGLALYAPTLVRSQSARGGTPQQSVDPAVLAGPDLTGEPFVFEGPILIHSNATIRDETTCDSHGFPQSVPNQQELLDLLRAREYARLNDILERYQREAEADFRKEAWISPAIWAFDTGDPALEPYLNAWVEAAPDSAVAHASRAEFYRGMGFAARGGAWAKDTSEAQFRGMRDAFRKSYADALAALNLNPRITVIYSNLIHLANAGGAEFGNERDHFEAGLKVCPNSAWLRNAYISSLRPRWGGSYQAMRTFAAEQQPLAEIDPRVRDMYGWVEWDLATLTSDQEERIELCTKALGYGERSMYYQTRGAAFEALGRYDEALADFSRAVEIWPLDDESWEWKIKVLATMGRPEDAGRELARAKRLFPNSHAIRRAGARVPSA